MAIKLIRITTIPLSLKILLKDQLKYLNNNGFQTYMVSSQGNEVNQLISSQGSPHFTLPLTRRITPVIDIFCIVKFALLCRRIKPNIVHSHTPKAGLVGMVGAYLGGIPVRLHTVAGLPLMEAPVYKKVLLKQVEKIIYRFSSQVYTNSNKLREYIILEKLCQPDKIKVIGHGSSNGINSDYFKSSISLFQESQRIRQLINIPKSSFTFIFIGRIVKDKGIIELITAFKELVKEYPNLRLLLVGSLEQELDPLPENILNDILSMDAIHYVGFKEDVRPYLILSQVLVFPSYREGFPNVPMQACLLDVPSIVSNINGCNEIIQPGINGFHVPVKDTKALMQMMKKIYENDELFKYLKGNARRSILERYEQGQFWKLLLEEYHLQLKVK